MKLIDHWKVFVSQCMEGDVMADFPGNFPVEVSDTHLSFYPEENHEAFILGMMVERYCLWHTDLATGKSPIEVDVMGSGNHFTVEVIWTLDTPPTLETVTKDGETSYRKVKA